MPSTVCKNCNGTDIDRDPQLGTTVCTNCGYVLEDSLIVAEVQFQENAGGSSSVIGQFVSAEGTHILLHEKVTAYFV
jgi:transcription factor IIIB subunit 2